MSARSVLLAGCRWLRQKLDLVERLAEEDDRRVCPSQQSNFSAQIVDRVNHTSLSLETRQSDTVLTVSEGRAA
jgi:hypothetical protein